MNQNNTKSPGIPFDASKPEDLARLKAGWPLVQRDGTKFEGKFLCVAENNNTHRKLVFLHRGEIFDCSKTGQYDLTPEFRDLFFAANKTRKSKWVAVVRDEEDCEHTVTYHQKQYLLDDAPRNSWTILSGPVELSWEVDAPLHPVEQPKAGWYVGPVKEGNHAKDLAKYAGLPVTYGTLTEVQP
jgi:heat shock protein HspQ